GSPAIRPVELERHRIVPGLDVVGRVNDRRYSVRTPVERKIATRSGVGQSAGGDIPRELVSATLRRIRHSSRPVADKLADSEAPLRRFRNLVLVVHQPELAKTKLRDEPVERGCIGCEIRILESDLSRNRCRTLRCETNRVGRIGDFKFFIDCDVERYSVVVQSPSAKHCGAVSLVDAVREPDAGLEGSLERPAVVSGRDVAVEIEGYEQIDS